MPETCGEPHPTHPEVTCEKPKPCYELHYNLAHQMDWDGPPAPPPPPPRASRKAAVATIAGHIPAATMTGPPEGLDPRTHARRNDPDTSHAAAQELSDQTTMMRALLTSFTDEPLTFEEAADRAGYDPWASSKRVSDLALGGYIEDTGDRRPGESGRDQIVRAITDKGRAALLSEEPIKPSGIKRSHSCWATGVVAEVRDLEKEIRDGQALINRDYLVRRLGEILGYDRQPRSAVVPDFD